MIGICEVCGLAGECTLTIIPGPEMDQDHVYTFKCYSCEHTEEKIRYGGSSVGNNPISICPFCGCESREHEIVELSTR